MYYSKEEFQQDADIWLNYYNTKRTHSGKYCNGKTPIKTFFDGIELAKNYYIEKAYKRENVEKENDEYILHQLDFMFANYGQRKYKGTVNYIEI